MKSAALNNELEIAIYLPPLYSPRAEPYPLLVLFDKDAYLNEAGKLALIPTPTILDNLISEARISPMVALLVGNAPGARNRELPCNPEFTRALVTELLPWAHRLYNFARDPRHTVVAGSSFGGLAAACAGLWYPETFGNEIGNGTDKGTDFIQAENHGAFPGLFGLRDLLEGPIDMQRILVKKAEGADGAV